VAHEASAAAPPKKTDKAGRLKVSGIVFIKYKLFEQNPSTDIAAAERLTLEALKKMSLIITGTNITLICSKLHWEYTVNIFEGIDVDNFSQ
jgi:hypothetical protein